METWACRNINSEYGGKYLNPIFLAIKWWEINKVGFLPVTMEAKAAELAKQLLDTVSR
jgi:hypothetical protein